VDPTGRYLRAWKPVPPCPQFDKQRVLSRFFSLLLPLPTASSTTTIMANEKPQLRSWKLEPNPTVTRERPTERKTALEITENTTIRLRRTKCGVGPLCPVRDQRLPNFDIEVSTSCPPLKTFPAKLSLGLLSSRADRKSMKLKAEIWMMEASSRRS
jgi:hypothetical protein